jgi:diadenosine tetraphosphate (Ap4A) HIT family hydrolase
VIYRFRKGQRKYENFKRPPGCAFCDLSQMELIEEYKHSRLVRNTFPYDVWDSHDVREHLMLVPKRHVAGLGELTSEEQLEIMQRLADFEAHDYSIYARALHSKRRSVPTHQHTHLIKAAERDIKFMISIEKPYFLFRR